MRKRGVWPLGSLPLSEALAEMITFIAPAPNDCHFIHDSDVDTRGISIDVNDGFKFKDAMHPSTTQHSAEHHREFQ